MEADGKTKRFFIAMVSPGGDFGNMVDRKDRAVDVRGVRREGGAVIHTGIIRISFPRSGFQSPMGQVFPLGRVLSLTGA